MSAHSHIEKIEKEPEFVSANPPPTYPAGQSQYYRKIGNPGPLGLYAFATTTFILSMYNTQARGISHPNVVVGMALFVGGAAQFVAGMWEFATANTFGATAFTMFGGFWMSFGTIFIPGSGITAAYTNSEELDSALGIYLFAWMIVTALLFIATLRRNMALVILFGSLTITFALLGAGKFDLEHAVALDKAGGAMGIITAFVAYYIGTAEMLSDRRTSWFVLPVGPIPQREMV
ncbi:FUN34 transmembrane protein [Trametes elegans]|nr:FUN34 transmembrane protein [Trametes elegans]